MNAAAAENNIAGIPTNGGSLSVARSVALSELRFYDEQALQPFSYRGSTKVTPKIPFHLV